MKIADLHQIFLESTGVCTDTRKIKKNSLFFALKGDNFNGNKFALKSIELGANYAVIDENTDETHPNLIFVEDVLKILQDLAAYHRKYLNIPILAITGSNGKTTTKELIHAVLAKKYRTTATVGNLNNHIGVPLTLLSMTKSTEFGIVEMGANHQKEIQNLCEIAQPDYGYITNFGKAHLEGFKGFEGVIKGKSELYDHLIKNKKRIFINFDDELQQKQSKNGEVISFSEGKNADYQITLLSASPFVKMTTENISINSNLIGTYNAKNISAAICIGIYFKIAPSLIKEAIEAYEPKNNRSQIIKRNSNEIILDAYNANPTSMAAALENFNSYPSERKTVILGDMFEVGESSLEEHQHVIQLLEEYDFTSSFVCGENFYKTTSNKIEKLKDYTSLKERIETENFEDTVILIKGSRGMALERILEVL